MVLTLAVANEAEGIGEDKDEIEALGVMEGVRVGEKVALTDDVTVFSAAVADRVPLVQGVLLGRALLQLEVWLTEKLLLREFRGDADALGDFELIDGVAFVEGERERVKLVEREGEWEEEADLCVEALPPGLRLEVGEKQEVGDAEMH